MRKLADQVMCSRTLVDVGPADRRRVEQALEKETKRPASATQVGEVFGCSDERGLNVLLAPRPGGGAELTVNDIAPGHRVLPVLALLLALMALSFVGLSMWKGGLAGMVAGLILVAIAAGFQLGGRLDRWRRQRRVRRVADAIAEVAVRARIELDGSELDGSDEREDDEHETRETGRALDRGRARAD